LIFISCGILTVVLTDLATTAIFNFISHNRSFKVKDVIWKEVSLSLCFLVTYLLISIIFEIKSRKDFIKSRILKSAPAINFLVFGGLFTIIFALNVVKIILSLITDMIATDWEDVIDFISVLFILTLYFSMVLIVPAFILIFGVPFTKKDIKSLLSYILSYEIANGAFIYASHLVRKNFPDFILFDYKGFSKIFPYNINYVYVFWAVMVPLALLLFHYDYRKKINPYKYGHENNNYCNNYHKRNFGGSCVDSIMKESHRRLFILRL